MRVLIVGCGYVGLPLGAELVRNGHTVFGLRRSLAASAELKGVGIQPLAADISRREDLTRLPAAYDWIVNCAAASGGGIEDYRRTYVEGTQNLIDWLSGAPVAKFVYTSSTGVYGQDDGSLVDESCATEPDSETGRILVEAERVLLRAAQATKFPAVILRVSGIYGPGRGYYLRQMLSGQARLEGGGSRYVNMIHRDDIVGAIQAALERGVPGAVYNVSDDAPATVREVYSWLATQLNQAPPPSAPQEATLSRRRGATHKRISNQRLRAELGYALKYPTFREGYAAELARR